MNNQNYGKNYPSQLAPPPARPVDHAPDQTYDAQSVAPAASAVHMSGALNQEQEGPVDISAAQTVQIASTQQKKSFMFSRASYRKMNRKFLAGVLLCFLLLTGIVGYILYEFVVKSSPNVTLYRVTMQSVNEDIGGGGTGYPEQQLNISYPFTANVVSVFVQPGEKVTSKQPLMQLDLSQVNAQYITQLNAEAAQAYQNMLSEQAYLDSVLRVGNSVVIAQAEQQYAAAQANYRALQVEADASSLHQGKISSPISGTVTAVNVYQGQSIGANHVMLTIYDESKIIFHANMPLSNYGQVQINQPAQVTPSATPDQTYSGKVITIIPNANAQFSTFEVWVVVDNTTGNLLPGMSAFVHVQNTIRALVIPRLAVLNPDIDSAVFIERQQHVYLQHVQILGYQGDLLLIGSGLHVNDVIVLVGINVLHDGQSVHVTGVEN